MVPTLKPSMMKPTSGWAKNGHDGKWHYIVQHDDDKSPFCGAACVLTGRREDGKYPPKGLVCPVCKAEAAQNNHTLSNNDSLQKKKKSLSAKPANSTAPTTSVQHSQINISLQTRKNLEKFMNAINSLLILAEECRKILAEKSEAKCQLVGGVINISSETVEQAINHCTKCLTIYPPNAEFWKLIPFKSTRPDATCISTELSARFKETMDRFKCYSDEEEAELVEAGKGLSDLLTTSIGITFQKAFDKMPVNMQEAITRSMKRKKWSEEYLSDVARRVLQEERVAVETHRAKDEASKLQLSKKAYKPKVVSETNTYWDRNGQNGKRGGLLDPARNSTSGVIGNPTHKRW